MEYEVMDVDATRLYYNDTLNRYATGAMLEDMADTSGWLPVNYELPDYNPWTEEINPNRYLTRGDDCFIQSFAVSPLADRIVEENLAHWRRQLVEQIGRKDEDIAAMLITMLNFIETLAESHRDDMVNQLCSGKSQPKCLASLYEEFQKTFLKEA